MGEIADSMIEKMIWGCNDDYEGELYPRKKVTATEVAEELYGKKDQNLRKAKDINKGVIEW